MRKYASNAVNFDDFKATNEKTDSSVIQFLREYYSKHLPVDITAWARVNTPPENAILKERFSEQISFVRDTLSVLLSTSIEEHNTNPVLVISTFSSRAIKLPIYQFKSEIYGLEVILCDNFFNWKVSVNSKIPIDFDIMGLFDTEKAVPSHCCIGFPENKVYGSYDQNHSQFTFESFSNYNLYTFIFLLSKYLEKKVGA